MAKDQAPTIQELLATERRGRLAAERLLEMKQAELFRANRRLGEHAKLLTDEITIKRKEVKTVRSEAEALRGQNTQVNKDLEKANQQANLAERRLWDALETIQDGFAVFNRRDQLLIANRSYLAIFDGLDGIRPGVTYEELLILLVNEGIVDIGREEPQAWCNAMLERWQQPTIEPVTLKLWNETYIKLMDRRAQDGDLVSLALDITDTVRHEAEMEDAPPARRSRGSRQGGISRQHEPRNPNTHERGGRHVRTVDRKRSGRGTAALCGDDQELRRGAPGHHQ